MKFALNGTLWYGAICYGAHKIIANHEELNQINVFPVADGDTGQNLVALMQSILRHDIKESHFAKTSESIARAALLGSRGNSGAIFSQFLCGFIPQDVSTEGISLTDFAELSLIASKGAYQAVDTPQEGTILSVMESWAKKIYEGSTKNPERWLDVFRDSYISAQEALHKTTQQLPVLRGTLLVDAGAKAFVYFLEGILSYFESPEKERLSRPLNDLKELAINLEKHSIPEAKPELRYCTEALLSELKMPLANIKPILKTCCDSIVIAGNKTDARIHFHTNEPQKSIALLEQYGDIQQTKVEDMFIQYLLYTSKKANICLLIDSSADLPQELIDKNMIHVLPIQLQVDNHHHLDRYSITTERVYEKIQNGHSKISTSMPDILMTERTLQILAKEYEHIIAITIASKQSGTCQLIRQASERLQIKNISVIDSLRNSAAHGLLVKRAAKLIENGLPANQIIQHIENLRLKSNIIVAVQDIQYMQRSGRLSNTKANILKSLNLKPIIALNEEGSGYLFAKAFGFKNSIRKLVRKVLGLSESLTEYAIVHADAETIATALKLELTEKLGKEPAYVMEVSAAIGLHAGPGCVAVAILQG